MESTIVKKTSKSITIQVTIPVESKDMLTHIAADRQELYKVI
jgi:hypothetical protein